MNTSMETRIRKQLGYMITSREQKSSNIWLKLIDSTLLKVTDCISLPSLMCHALLCLLWETSQHLLSNSHFCTVNCITSDDNWCGLDFWCFCFHEVEEDGWLGDGAFFIFYVFFLLGILFEDDEEWMKMVEDDE